MKKSCSTELAFLLGVPLLSVELLLRALVGELLRFEPEGFVRRAVCLLLVLLGDLLFDFVLGVFLCVELVVADLIDLLDLLDLADDGLPLSDLFASLHLEQQET